MRRRYPTGNPSFICWKLRGLTRGWSMPVMALSTCSVWRASEIIQCVVEEGRSVLSGGSGCGGPPGDFVPGTEAVGHLAAVFLGVEQVTTVPEVR
jgi:hypothetical protein